MVQRILKTDTHNRKENRQGEKTMFVQVSYVFLTLLNADSWLDKIEAWIRGVVDNIFDIGALGVFAVLGVALMVIAGNAVYTVIRMRLANIPWGQVLQETLGAFGTSLILAVISVFPAAFLATRGIFGEGIQRWINNIFG